VTPENWQTVVTKKVAGFFRKKIGLSPSVAVPGDTHPSDATGSVQYTLLKNGDVQ